MAEPDCKSDRALVLSVRVTAVRDRPKSASPKAFPGRRGPKSPQDAFPMPESFERGGVAYPPSPLAKDSGGEVIYHF